MTRVSGKLASDIWQEKQGVKPFSLKDISQPHGGKKLELFQVSCLLVCLFVCFRSVTILSHLILSWRSKFNSYLPSIMYFGQPVSVNYPVYTTDNKECLPLVSVWRGRFRMTLTWTKNVEKTSCYDREFPAYRQRWVKTMRSSDTPQVKPGTEHGDQTRVVLVAALRPLSCSSSWLVNNF